MTKYAHLKVPKSNVEVWVDCSKITHAIRPTKDYPPFVFIEGITEAFELIGIGEGTPRPEPVAQPEHYSL